MLRLCFFTFFSGCLTSPLHPATNLSIVGHVVHFPGPGRLVLSGGDGTWFQDLNVSGRSFEIPPEVSGLVHAKWVGVHNEYASRNFQVSYVSCTPPKCIFCIDLLYERACLPPSMRYVLYGLLAILLFVGISCTHKIFIVFRDLGICVLLTWKRSFHMVKLSLRFALFCGRRLALVTRLRLGRLENIIVFLTILLKVQPTPHCTSVFLIDSLQRACLTNGTCSLSTEAEISFPHLGSTACLHTKAPEKPLLIALKLSEVNCLFHTEREYFSSAFDVQVNSTIVCPNNEYCGWLEHCHENYTAVPGLGKPNIGGYDCLPLNVRLGTGCGIIHRPACHHFTYNFVPKDPYFEVRAIRNYNCDIKLTLEIVAHSNSTISVISSGSSDSKGILVETTSLAGNDVTFISEKLLVDLNTSTAIFSAASAGDSPVAGTIGSIQYNSSQFSAGIFADNLLTCHNVAFKVRCRAASHRLGHLFDPLGDATLPLVRGDHRFSFLDGQLSSIMIKTPPIEATITLSELQVELVYEATCPVFEEITSVTGCYSCNIPANIRIKAYSSCDQGLVEVDLKGPGLENLKPMLKLQTLSGEHEVYFRSEQRCFTFTLCLHSSDNRACLNDTTCLSSPTIHLGRAAVPSITGQQVFSPHASLFIQIRKFFGRIWTGVQLGMIIWVLLFGGLFLLGLIVVLCRS